MLHDLARDDRGLSGRTSAAESAGRARDLLEDIGFPRDKMELVCEAIREHDQRDVSPRSVEGKILKDADFLDGFGARGIARAALWTGEAGQGFDMLVRRLKVRMPARIKSLEFKESRLQAEKEESFVRLFLALLETEPKLGLTKLIGKYIVLEGISGAGKTVQAKRLIRRLEAADKNARMVVEPTEDRSGIMHAWRDQLRARDIEDGLAELFMFVADRSLLMSTQVMDDLKAGRIVVSVRSFMSSMVYQTTDAYDLAFAAFVHQFVPRPDLLILLDVPAQIARERIVRRYRQTGKRPSKNEAEDRLSRDRIRYKEVLRAYFPEGRIVNGAGSSEEVEEEIWKIVSASEMF